MLLFAYIILAAGLVLALIGLDANRRQCSSAACLLGASAAVVLLVTGALEPVAFLLVGAAMLYGLLRTRIGVNGLVAVGDLLMIALALVLGLHLVPNFPHLPLSHSVPAGALAAPSFAHIDKAFAGLMLLLVVPASRRWDWRALLLIPAGIALVVALGLLAGLHWRPQWSADGWWLLGVNLISTVIAEEALFRGLVQRRAQDFLQGNRHGRWFALIAASVLFGLAHWGGGISLVILSTVAGIVYGLVYQVGGKLSLAIAAHVGLNASAFFLLAN